MPLVQLISESDEFPIFNNENIDNFIEYKWASFGKRWHQTSTGVHALFILYLIWYTNYVYIEASLQLPINDPNYQTGHAQSSYHVFFLLFAFWPIVYEGV